MDKTNKYISGLSIVKIVIQKPSKYFIETEKHQIIQELLISVIPKQRYGNSIPVRLINTGNYSDRCENWAMITKKDRASTTLCQEN